MCSSATARASCSRKRLATILIIGGTGGNATLNGGSGQDLVIAGSTSYDSNQASLQAIENFWAKSGWFVGRQHTSLRREPKESGYSSARASGWCSTAEEQCDSFGSRLRLVSRNGSLVK